MVRGERLADHLQKAGVVDAAERSRTDDEFDPGGAVDHSAAGE
jgi:hypothetical protein